MTEKAGAEERSAPIGTAGRPRVGEVVLLYAEEDDSRFFLVYQPGLRKSTHLGDVRLPPEDQVHFGMPLVSNTGARFYLLPPTTADLAMRVRRRTNIIYPKDAGLILLETGIQAGSRVVEVGTGSGALTIVLARAVGPEGRVLTFERRQDLLENARANVARAGLLDRVQFHLLDPAREGFGVADADAVIVDVPEPWTLVEAAYRALKGGGAWASLSPTINQVDLTVRFLRGWFTRIRTVEVLLREMLVREGRIRPRERMVSHTGYLTFAQKVYAYE